MRMGPVQLTSHPTLTMNRFPRAYIRKSRGSIYCFLTEAGSLDGTSDWVNALRGTEEIGRRRRCGLLISGVGHRWIFFQGEAVREGIFRPSACVLMNRSGGDERHRLFCLTQISHPLVHVEHSLDAPAITSLVQELHGLLGERFDRLVENTTAHELI